MAFVAGNGSRQYIFLDKRTSAADVSRTLNPDLTVWKYKSGNSPTVRALLAIIVSCVTLVTIGGYADISHAIGIAPTIIAIAAAALALVVTVPLVVLLVNEFSNGSNLMDTKLCIPLGESAWQPLVDRINKQLALYETRTQDAELAAQNLLKVSLSLTPVTAEAFADYYMLGKALDVQTAHANLGPILRDALTLASGQCIADCATKIIAHFFIDEGAIETQIAS